MTQLSDRKPPGGAASPVASDTVTVGAAGDATDWSWRKITATNNRLELRKGTTIYAVFDPTSTFTKIGLYPQGDGNVGLRVNNWGAAGDTVDGLCVNADVLSPSNALVFMPDLSGAAGKKLQIAAYNGSAWKVGFEIAHASGTATVKLAQGTNLSFFGGAGTGQATMGAATADGGGTTQTMVQTMWDWLRAAGAGT